MTQLCHLRQSWSLAKRLRSLRNQGRWEEVSHRVTFAMFLRSMGKFEVSATKKTRHTFGSIEQDSFHRALVRLNIF